MSIQKNSKISSLKRPVSLSGFNIPPKMWCLQGYFIAAALMITSKTCARYNEGLPYGESLPKKSVFVSVNFCEWKSIIPFRSIKISWKISHSMISVALFTQVCAFWLKIGQMGQTIVNIYKRYTRSYMLTIVLLWQLNAYISFFRIVLIAFPF